MSMSKVRDALKKNTMLIALVVITIFFAWKTNGTLLAPQNITNLISQNGYVVILAVGMLLCILTGGNIDLSVGSIVALVGALAGKLIVTYKMNIYVAILIFKNTFQPGRMPILSTFTALFLLVSG